MTKELLRSKLACLCVVLVSLCVGRSAFSAEGSKVFRIGVLGPGSNWRGQPPFLIASELRKLGYVEGENLIYEYRGAHGDPDRYSTAAEELVKLNVNVIVAVANQGAFAAQRATRKIPIVVWGAHGALETGLVTNCVDREAT